MTIKKIAHFFICALTLTTLFSLSNDAHSQIKEPPQLDRYIEKWIKIPNIEGSLPSGEADIIKHKKGYVTVAFFLASWCIPCQKFTKELKQIEEQYKNLNVRVIYVFNHDLISDMNGFRQAHGIKSSLSILATNDALFSFRDPTLPTIFIADKHGWIINKFVGTKDNSIKSEDITKALDYLILK